MPGATVKWPTWQLTGRASAGLTRALYCQRSNRSWRWVSLPGAAGCPEFIRPDRARKDRGVCCRGGLPQHHPAAAGENSYFCPGKNRAAGHLARIYRYRSDPGERAGSTSRPGLDWQEFLSDLTPLRILFLAGRNSLGHPARAGPTPRPRLLRGVHALYRCLPDRLHLA